MLWDKYVDSSQEPWETGSQKALQLGNCLLATNTVYVISSHSSQERP